MEEIKVKVKGGYIKAIVSSDPNYPGIDVEFVPNNYNSETLSIPRGLFEKPADGELRALIWDDADNEDYTKEIVFN